MAVLRRNITSIFKDERGNVFILTALFLVVLLGMTVFAVDVGSLYLNRRQVVNAADSAAMAGAQEIVRALQDGVTDDAGVRTRVESVVVEYLDYHEADLIEVTEQDGSPIGANSKTVKVIADKEAKLYFAPAFYALLGANSTDSSDVGAAATAIIRPVCQPRVLAPFAMHESLWPEDGEEFTLTYHFSPGQEDPDNPWGSGNWGPVNFEGPGANQQKIRGWIQDGYEGELSAGDTIWAAPSTGISSGPTLQAINYHIDNETELIVPVITGSTSGTGEVTIVGFAVIVLIEPKPEPGRDMEIHAIVIIHSFTFDDNNCQAMNFGLETASLIE
jgi:hypothetical protein